MSAPPKGKATESCVRGEQHASSPRVGNGPLEEEIDRNALSDPDNQITMNILYIYSMESFICKMINDATRNQDETKIQTLGPFAAVLTQILSLAYANTEEAQKIQKPASKSKMFMGGIDKN